MQIITAQNQQLYALMDSAVQHLAPSSIDTYRKTFSMWLDWCADNDLAPYDLYAQQIIAFVERDNSRLAKTTQSRQLTTLGSLLKELRLNTFDFSQAQRLDREIAILKRYMPRGKSRTRQNRALSHADVREILHAWDGDICYEIRNAALMGVLLGTGVRIAEALALDWTDIDLQHGTIEIWHGKGDKYRTVAIYSDDAIQKLYRLQGHSPSGGAVFLATKPYTGEGWTARRLSYQGARSVITATVERTGIPFTAHDARHTLLTALPSTADAQAQAGHSNASTTAIYRHAADARTRKQHTDIGY